MTDSGLILSQQPTKPIAIGDILGNIRPAWQSKALIQRVVRLLPVDPSSACQRLFNAAIHDLREKVIIAGIDIAKEVASENKLPPVNKEEDIEDYPTAKLIDLCYRMGLLTRPEWKKIHRAYEIRRDLEHEDDEYEAAFEDCIYIFKTSIDVVLSRDPVELLRVKDVKEIVEENTNLTASYELLENYERAPQARQKEICMFLIGVAADSGKPDIIRENCYNLLRRLESITHTPVKIELAAHLQKKMDKKGIDILHAKIANACGAMIYFKKSQILDFYKELYIKLSKIGTRWTNYEAHEEILTDFEDIGGLTYCPDELMNDILKWLVLTYIGEPGEYGFYGRNRKVFYSNTASPIIERLIKNAPQKVKQLLEEIRNNRDIKQGLKNLYVARRFENLLDIVEPIPESRQ